MSEVDKALGRIGAWAWRRHGEETGNEDPNPLDRLKAEAKADAFQEVSKYIDTVRQAREE